jgi:hypothetical protein
VKTRWPGLKLSTEARGGSSRKNASDVPSRPVAAFSPTVFLDHLVSFIVADDQVSPNEPTFFFDLMCLQSICIVECPEFRQLCMVLRETLKDSDIPGRNRVREAIIARWKTSFEELKVDLSVSTVYCYITRHY